MAVSSIRRSVFTVQRLWNRTLGGYFKKDIYGVMLFGIRFTPKSVAEKLGGFNDEQLRDFNISPLGSYWVITRKVA